MFDPDLIDQEQARAERDGTLKHTDTIVDGWSEMKVGIKHALWAALMAELQEVRKKTIQDAVRSFIAEYDHRPEFKPGPPPFKLKPPHLQPFRGNKRLAAGSGRGAR